MTLDALVATLTTLAGVVVPVAGRWAWTTQSTLTQHTTILAEREESEKEWKTDLKERLARIEDKLDAKA